MKTLFSLDEIIFNDLGTHFWWEVWRLTLPLPGPKGITEAGPAILRFRYTLRLRSFPETTFQALALGKIPEWCLGRDEGGSDRVQVQVLGCPKNHVLLLICHVSSI